MPTSIGRLNLCMKRHTKCEAVAKIRGKPVASLRCNDHVWYHRAGLIVRAVWGYKHTCRVCCGSGNWNSSKGWVVHIQRSRQSGDWYQKPHYQWRSCSLRRCSAVCCRHKVVILNGIAAWVIVVCGFICCSKKGISLESTIMHCVHCGGAQRIIYNAWECQLIVLITFWILFVIVLKIKQHNPR